MEATESVNDDAIFMHRALQLAALGLGNVSPNPMVGCVIVHENKIIGEGYHQIYGQSHAEVNAIQSVENQKILPSATLYVNLEPCSHWGKTPPCADLIIEKKIKKVVVSNLDPNPKVAGKGIEKLRIAGIEVELGLLENEGNRLNRRFFTFQTKQRPYIILKWAETADGFIAKENFDSKWISNQYSRLLVHKWRSEEDAVLVGFNTAWHDNPQLNVRDVAGRNPVRIVIDAELGLPVTHHLFDYSQNTIIINRHKSSEGNLTNYMKSDLKTLNGGLNSLYESGIQSVIVEGGSKTLQRFIDENLWDETRIFTSPISFESGIKAPQKRGKLLKSEEIIGNILETYTNTWK